MELVAMLSNEKERVEFVRMVLLDTDLAVEQWMIEIEQVMRLSLRHYLHEAFYFKQRARVVASARV